MAIIDRSLSTGLPGFDKVIRGLIPGDNIVWQVDSIESYAMLVRPYAQRAKRSGRAVVYFHFGFHEKLIQDDPAVRTCLVDPRLGFEDFIHSIHQAIEEAGRGAFYIFDCLSDLAHVWYSDEMLGNFFMLTCPYLYDLETIAYFAMLRDQHSFFATVPIEMTTQLLLNVYRRHDKLFVHPLKVQGRHSPTMYMMHAWEGDAFKPVTESHVISDILNSLDWQGLQSTRQRLGIWSRTFQKAEEILDEIGKHPELGAFPPDLFNRLIRMAIAREGRVSDLVSEYFTPRDIIAIRRRMIGTGLIGGKSVGMLLARAILKKSDPKWEEILEAHDSFFIGSDVFYTYLVRNGCWWAHQRTRKSEANIKDAVRARQRILRGNFPDYIVQQFEDMLDYFGQSPIIVRSSSLLEDNFGNAFAGKYESVFCPNQGPRERCLTDFLAAVRTIYASTMSEKALLYRAKRGILDQDEQMALLVQRVSGNQYEALFFPQIAGVGFSFNPYAWNKDIDPEAGLLRLVFGLGTRAVDRSDDDYTRIVSLGSPEMRPEGDFDEMRQFTQRRVDVLDFDANQQLSKHFDEVMSICDEKILELVTSRDSAAERRAREMGRPDRPRRVLTFDKLLRDTDFVPEMREMLQTLQSAYDYPVDVEFTTNFIDEKRHKVNLVQCRPLQVQGGGTIIAPFPENIERDRIVLEARGATIGQSRLQRVDRVIYVPPVVYGVLPIQQRYAVARLIGQIMLLPEEKKPETVMLVGPGRWGTTTPSLGVPVSFAEISQVSSICEIVYMREDLIPDVSLGTHFFSDIVEMEMLYMALFPDQEGNSFNRDFLEGAKNRLVELLPEARQLDDAVRVIDLDDERPLRLHANTIEQRVICYFE
jgi:hypothetical protein